MKWFHVEVSDKNYKVWTRTPTPALEKVISLRLQAGTVAKWPQLFQMALSPYNTCFILLKSFVFDMNEAYTRIYFRRLLLAYVWYILFHCIINLNQCTKPHKQWCLMMFILNDMYIVYKQHTYFHLMRMVTNLLTLIQTRLEIKIHFRFNAYTIMLWPQGHAYIFFFSCITSYIKVLYKSYQLYKNTHLINTK